MPMKRILGTLTIGQTPRVDLIPEMREMMGPRVEVIEAGALDGLTLDEVAKFSPGPGDPVLVTRMADGTAVRIAEKHIVSRMQAKIDRLVDQGAEIIGLVCTGEFPEFRCDRLIVRPDRVLLSAASAVASGLRIGALVPDAEQVSELGRRWAAIASPSAARCESASPYGPLEPIGFAAESLKQWGADIVVMDCIGYTLAMKDMVKQITKTPVMLARTILARTLAELL